MRWDPIAGNKRVSNPLQQARKKRFPTHPSIIDAVTPTLIMWLFWPLFEHESLDQKSDYFRGLLRTAILKSSRRKFPAVSVCQMKLHKIFVRFIPSSQRNSLVQLTIRPDRYLTRYRSFSSFPTTMKRTLANKDRDLPNAKRVKLSTQATSSPNNNNSNKNETRTEEKSNRDDSIPQVTICGGGNGAHAFVVTVGASINPKFKVNWLSLYKDESERINNELDKNDGYLSAHLKQENIRMHVKPNLVTNDPSKVIPNSDIIMYVLFVFLFVFFQFMRIWYFKFLNKIKNKHTQKN